MAGCSPAFGSGFIDLNASGSSGLIGCPVFETAAGLVLIDPGPPSTLNALLAGLADRGLTLSDVAAILLTGSSLWHAEGALEIASRNRRVRLMAPAPLADVMERPGRLAHRLSTLYGRPPETEPDFGPRAGIERLRAGEPVSPGGRTFQVQASTLRDAVIFIDRATATAAPGIALGGVTHGATAAYLPRSAGGELAIDVPTALASIDADVFALTHFGLHPRKALGDALAVASDTPPSSLRPYLLVP